MTVEQEHPGMLMAGLVEIMDQVNVAEFGTCDMAPRQFPALRFAVDLLARGKRALRVRHGLHYTSAYALARAGVSAFQSSAMLGRNAAAAMVLQTTISMPVVPVRKTGGSGMMIRATVNTIANG